MFFCTSVISADNGGQAWQMRDFFNVVLSRLQHNLFHLNKICEMKNSRIVSKELSHL